MSYYLGPATVVCPDGVEAEIIAEIALQDMPAPGVVEWGGTGRAHADEFALATLGEVRLRLPDGREPMPSSAWPPSRPRRKSIAGNSPPPFDICV
jgi:hypothetical protein